MYIQVSRGSLTLSGYETLPRVDCDCHALRIYRFRRRSIRNQAVLAQLKTRAERTDYKETSRYDDVMSFLNMVGQNSELVHLTTMGYTSEGRPLPLAIVGRVSDSRPETVKSSGKLRIYIQSNVHAGEVEGKESSYPIPRTRN